MLNRLFRRRSSTGEPPEAGSAEPAEAGLWHRIKAFFVALWNWTILLIAIAAMLLFARVTVFSWNSAADATDTGTIALFGGLAALSGAATIFLIWQVWGGVRYLLHRRRERRLR